MHVLNPNSSSIDFQQLCASIKQVFHELSPPQRPTLNEGLFAEAPIAEPMLTLLSLFFPVHFSIVEHLSYEHIFFEHIYSEHLYSEHVSSEYVWPLHTVIAHCAVHCSQNMVNETQSKHIALISHRFKLQSL